jgi:hypothetical protein
MTGIRLTALVTVLVLLASPAFARDVRRLTADWRFKEKDGNWQTVSLPHTAHIEPYVLAQPMWMGICHYQKEIDYEPAWEGKKVSVEFEGAMLVAKVSLNGNLLTERFDGYMGFEVDLTPHLKKGKNLLEVELDNNWRGDVPLGKPYKQLDFRLVQRSLSECLSEGNRAPVYHEPAGREQSSQRWRVCDLSAH